MYWQNLVGEDVVWKAQEGTPGDIENAWNEHEPKDVKIGNPTNSKPPQADSRDLEFYRGNPFSSGVTSADFEALIVKGIGAEEATACSSVGPSMSCNPMKSSLPSLNRRPFEEAIRSGELPNGPLLTNIPSRAAENVQEPQVPKPKETDEDDNLKGLNRWQRMKQFKNQVNEERAAKLEEEGDEESAELTKMSAWQRKRHLATKAKEKASAQKTDEEEDAENFKSMTPWQKKKFLMAKMKESHKDEETIDFDGMDPRDVSKSVLAGKKRKFPYEEDEASRPGKREEESKRGGNLFDKEDIADLGPPKIVSARSLVGGFSSSRIGLSKSGANSSRTKNQDPLHRPFQNPLPQQQDQMNDGYHVGGELQRNNPRNKQQQQTGGVNGPAFLKTALTGPNGEKEEVDPAMRNLDPKMIEMIENEIMDTGTFVHWDDIAGLEGAKKVIKEIVVMPMLRPDIFTGLRGPPKGLLLFGPPGTGKTLIGKCLASQAKATFFNISSSALTSKWFGEAEKLVRTLFAVARKRAPSVIFLDEVDSVLTARSGDESDSVRRIKTEFFVQLDGAGTGEERVLLVGATNRPQELDDAARRRFVRRLYIPLPEPVARRQIIGKLMEKVKSALSTEDLETIVARTEGYSGADMKNLCQEASFGPVRSVPPECIETIKPEDLASVTLRDFQEALDTVRPSVAQADLHTLVEWDKTYGSGSSR